MTKEQIVDYYRQCQFDYELFWDLKQSYAMHAGYWDHTTSNLSEALTKENEILAKMAKIHRNDLVLDAGCGIGGSSFYLAKNLGCRVVGISICSDQIQQANSLAERLDLASKVSFFEKDYTATHFPDHHFDVVWAVESVCHAQNKNDFINEAYRILRPGGRLVVADGFLSSYSSKNKQNVQTWLQGWGVNQLDTYSEFQDKLDQKGFTNISYTNISQQVLPSSKRLYRISFPAYFLSKMGEWFGLRTSLQTNNILSAYYQHQTLKEGLWEYGIFYAEKPA